MGHNTGMSGPNNGSHSPLIEVTKGSTSLRSQGNEMLCQGLPHDVQNRITAFRQQKTFCHSFEVLLGKVSATKRNLCSVMLDNIYGKAFIARNHLEEQIIGRTHRLPCLY